MPLERVIFIGSDVPMHSGGRGSSEQSSASSARPRHRCWRGLVAGAEVMQEILIAGGNRRTRQFTGADGRLDVSGELWIGKRRVVRSSSCALARAMHFESFRAGGGGSVLMTASSRWSCPTITSPPCLSRAGTAWRPPAGSASVMRIVIVFSIAAVPGESGRVRQADAGVGRGFGSASNVI